MNLLAIIIFISTLLLLITGLIFYIVLNNLKDEKCTVKKLRKISVIIAAKNEEHNLGKLFTSLSRLNYPDEYYEVILVDDNSTDGTYDTAKKIFRDKANFIVIRTEENDKLSHKRAALTTGIQKAKYNSIVITDADCTVTPNWLNCYADKLTEFDLVFGTAPLIHNGSIAGRISAFENLKSHILVFVLTRIGLPYSAASRNIGFRKASFNKLNGFERTSETLSGDDDLLIREAIKNRLKIGMITSKEAFVFSNAKKSLNEYFRQKARHTSSSHHYLISRKILLAVWHFLNLAVLFSFPLSIINSIFVLPIIVKLIVDYLITNNFQYKFGYDFSPIEIVLLHIIYELTLPVHFVNSFRFKDRWE